MADNDPDAGVDVDPALPPLPQQAEDDAVAFLAAIMRLAQAQAEAVILQNNQNAAAAAAVLNPNAPAGAVGPVVPPTFALTPGASNAAFLDYDKSEAIKLFHKVIQPMDPKFSLAEDSLRSFLHQVLEQSRTYSWGDLLMIPDNSATPVLRSLIVKYGMVTMDECTDYAATFIGQQTRKAQNDIQLYKYLWASLTEPAKVLMLSDVEAYTVLDETSGVCFLKAIIGRASVDTNAKVSFLRKRIARLPETMRDEFKGNVSAFNVYVAETRDQLVGRGQPVDGLLTFLFDAYIDSVPDEEFHRYIEMYRNMYDDGKDIDPEQLMRSALIKYETIQQRKGLKGENEERIMALVTATEPTPVPATTNAELMETIRSLQASLAQRGTGKQGKKIRKIPDWKKSAPAEGAAITKQVNGKTYHWCGNHKMWCIHSERECTLGREGATPPRRDEGGNAEIALNRALTALLNQDMDE